MEHDEPKLFNLIRATVKKVLGVSETTYEAGLLIHNQQRYLVHGMEHFKHTFASLQHQNSYSQRPSQQIHLLRLRFIRTSKPYDDKASALRQAFPSTIHK